MRKPFTWSLVTFALCFAGDLFGADDWNQWRGSARDGAAAASPKLINQLPPGGLRRAWVSEAIPAGGNGGWSSPVVVGDKVYVFAHYQTAKPNVQLGDPKYPGLDEKKQKELSKEELEAYEANRQQEERERRNASYDVTEAVYALDVATGKTLWKNERPSVFTGFFHSGTPAVIGKRIYVLAPGGVARCVSASDGKDVWETKLAGNFEEQQHSSSFAVAEGVAVILAGRLFGLDARTGKLAWEGDSDKTSGAHSSPAIWKTKDRQLIVVNVRGQDTICVDPRNGEELWRVQSEANLSTPVVTGNRMLTLGDSRKKGLRCFELSLKEAKHLWTYTGAADNGSSPVVVGGHAYVQGGTQLACVALKTGKAAWKVELDMENPQYTSLAAADGKVYYAYGAVLWFKAEPSDYELLAEGRIDETGLLATDDTFRGIIEQDPSRESKPTEAELDQLVRDRTNGRGPVECASPAIADGRLYVRLSGGVACYDLREQGALAGE